MTLNELGAWLRQQRESRGWPRREMARRLIQAARTAGDVGIPGLESICTYIRRWEHGDGLTERYKLYYCAAFGIPTQEFGRPVDNTGLPVAAGSRPPRTASIAYRGMSASSLDSFAVEREVLMAAHEGGDHAEQYEQPGIGDVTFEQIRADVTRLAQLSDTGEPFSVFLTMRQLRQRIYRLLDRGLWPREQTNLHFLLGCLNGLMGIAANRLGYPDAAEELIRAGWAYAQMIDHRPLGGQLRQQLSSVVYLRGRYQESSDLAVSGLEYVSDGPEAAHLHLNHARAAASMADIDTARQAVRNAHEARERDYTDDLLEMGGEYAVSRATHHYLAGSALARMGGTQDQAADELERAMSLYDQGPGDGEQHWFGGKPLAGIDLAVVRLRSGALDGAVPALEPVLSIPPSQRIADFTMQLGAVREELAAPIFRGSIRARQLGEQIEDFGRATIVADLHSLPDGPA